MFRRVKHLLNGVVDPRWQHIACLSAIAIFPSTRNEPFEPAICPFARLQFFFYFFYCFGCFTFGYLFRVFEKLGYYKNLTSSSSKSEWVLLYLHFSEHLFLYKTWIFVRLYYDVSLRINSIFPSISETYMKKDRFFQYLRSIRKQELIVRNFFNLFNICKLFERKIIIQVFFIRKKKVYFKIVFLIVFEFSKKKKKKE